MPADCQDASLHAHITAILRGNNGAMRLGLVAVYALQQ